MAVGGCAANEGKETAFLGREPVRPAMLQGRKKNQFTKSKNHFQMQTGDPASSARSGRQEWRVWAPCSGS